MLLYQCKLLNITLQILRIKIQRPKLRKSFKIKILNKIKTFANRGRQLHWPRSGRAAVVIFKFSDPISTFIHSFILLFLTSFDLLVISIFFSYNIRHNVISALVGVSRLLWSVKYVVLHNC